MAVAICMELLMYIYIYIHNTTSNSNNNINSIIDKNINNVNIDNSKWKHAGFEPSTSLCPGCGLMRVSVKKDYN